MEVATDSIQILLVDDEPAFTEVTADVLEQKSDRLSVETATNAAEGLTRLAEGSFDCIVSDYDMPEQTGLEFLEAVREQYPELPFILFTGKGSEDVASDAISVGVTDYLQKRGNVAQYERLANRIENTVERARAGKRVTNQKGGHNRGRNRSEHGATIGGYSPERALRVNELLNTLSHSVRREIISYFENRPEGSTSLEELSAYLADRIPGKTRDTLVLELPQTHLPQLQSSGWLEYDRRTGQIAYHGREDATRALCEVLDLFAET